MIRRKPVQELARKHLQAGDPLGWFEVLYSGAEGKAEKIPWADLKPNANLLSWLDRQPTLRKARALVPGCGLGDDAAELSRRGWQVIGFDISPSAVEWCRRRFSEPKTEFIVADLLKPPKSWTGNFDLVLEAYTLQVLPADLRAHAMVNLTRFLAPQGKLVVICRGRERDESEGQMPWPLTIAELEFFRQEGGLHEESFEDFFDDERLPVRRFRAVYSKPQDP